MSQELESALDRVISLVDATADAALPGVPRTPQGDNERLYDCEEEFGGPGGRVMTQYGVSVELPPEMTPREVLERAAELWKREGHDVIRRNIDASPPAIFLEFDGYNFQVLVQEETGRAIIGGSTPCLPPA